MLEALGDETMTRLRLGARLFDLYWRGDLAEKRRNDPSKDASIANLAADPQLVHTKYRSERTINRVVWAGVLWRHLGSPSEPPLPNLTTMADIASAVEDPDEWAAHVERARGENVRSTQRRLQDANRPVVPLPSADHSPGWTTRVEKIDGHDALIAERPGGKPIVLHCCSNDVGLAGLARRGVVAGCVLTDPIYASERDAKKFKKKSAEAVRIEVKRDVEAAILILRDRGTLAIFQEKNTDAPLRAWLDGREDLGQQQTVYVDYNMTRRSSTPSKETGLHHGVVRGDDVLILAAKGRRMGSPDIPPLNRDWIKLNLPDVRMHVADRGMTPGRIWAKVDHLRREFPWIGKHPSPKPPQLIALTLALLNPRDLPIVESCAGMASGAVVAMQYGMKYHGFEENTEFWGFARERIEDLVVVLNGGATRFPRWSDLVGKPPTPEEQLAAAAAALDERVNDLAADDDRPLLALEGVLSLTDWEREAGGPDGVERAFRNLLRREPDVVAGILPQRALKDLRLALENEGAREWEQLRKVAGANVAFASYLCGGMDETGIDAALAAAGERFYDHLEWFFVALADLRGDYADASKAESYEP
ncbi:MAG: hypothetical protein IT350_12560 [Deltaproteobacteria bacterium]|nr:hypothetical protein [Deltaproteobacteria bacterium]